MSKLICKDCEQEVDKLNKKGLCKSCSSRIANAKHRNQKYIPLKVLKTTDPELYVKTLNRRKDVLNTQIDSPTHTVLNSKVLDIENEVKSDIQSFLDKKGISSDVKYESIDKLFEWLYVLCQQDNYISNMNVLKSCYDTCIVNYLHELKPQIGNEDPMFYAKVGKKMAIIQSLRTPLDNDLDQYNVIKPVFDYLKKDTHFMTLLSDCRIKLKDLLNKQASPYYLSDAPSLQQYDYVVNPNTEEPIERNLFISSGSKQKFSVSISRVKNLYGNKNYQEFTYNKPVYATDEKSCKEEFNNYFQKAFPNVIYKPNDIIVKPFIEKECL